MYTAKLVLSAALDIPTSGLEKTPQRPLELPGFKLKEGSSTAK
jgi:hypothetical protein